MTTGRRLLLFTTVVLFVSATAAFFWKDKPTEVSSYIPRLTPLETKERFAGMTADEMPQLALYLLLSDRIHNNETPWLLGLYDRIRALQIRLNLSPNPSIDEIDAVLANSPSSTEQELWKLALALHPNKRGLSLEVLAENGLGKKYLDALAVEFSRLADDSYVVVILPRGAAHVERIKKSLPSTIRQVHSKSILLTKNGARNYVLSAYGFCNDAPHHWTTDERKVARHIRERFTCEKPMQVWLVQASTPEELTDWKRSIRKELALGTVTIHATDSQREAEELAELLYNENGVHFLNYAKGINDSLLHQLEKKFTHTSTCFPLSTTLTLYGFVSENEGELVSNREMATIASDPTHYFCYRGMKFIAPQVYDN